MALSPSGRARPARELFGAAGLWAGACLVRDLEDGRGAVWAAVAFALGCAAYLGLPREPWLSALLAVWAAALAAAFVLRRHGGSFGATLVGCFLAGLVAGKIETILAEAPRLDRERTVMVSGWVESVEPTPRGNERIRLRVAAMEARGLEEAAIPPAVAITLARGNPPVAPGDAIRLRARLQPPAGPAIPGGYDFARRAFFEGRGASGFALGRAAPAEIGPPPWPLRLAAPLARARAALGDRIRETLPGPTGAIAAALIVGEQRAIPQAEQEALRAAGLSHILSISGLHMTLVAGGVYAAIRLVLALFPAIALRRHTAKWAAVAGFAAASVYLGISGAAVATQRAYVMFAIVLLAVLADRPAITLRSVAVAAVLVLAAALSSIAEPGFQMSFLAVIALVAAYETRAARPPRLLARAERGRLAILAADGGRAVIGLAVSSVVAGLATAPIVADTFYRAAPYGVIANVLVLPIVGFAIMPAAVLAALALPLGLDPWPLQAMGLGIDAMVGVAGWIAAWPSGDGLVGRVHPGTAPLAVVGLLWLTLWKASWRWLGLMPAAAALALMPFAERPSVLVSADGRTVAVRGRDGRLSIVGAKENRFATEIWLAADADRRDPLQADMATGWRCDALGCAFGPTLATGPPQPGAAVLRVALVRDPLAFDEDCRRADVVVSALAAPAGCAAHALVIDRDVLARRGAVALFPEGEGGGRSRLRVAASLPDFARPWTPRRPQPNPAAALSPPAGQERPMPSDPTAEPDGADSTSPVPDQ